MNNNDSKFQQLYLELEMVEIEIQPKQETKKEENNVIVINILGED